MKVFCIAEDSGANKHLDLTRKESNETPPTNTNCPPPVRCFEDHRSPQLHSGEYIHLFIYILFIYYFVMFFIYVIIMFQLFLGQLQQSYPLFLEFDAKTGPIGPAQCSGQSTPPVRSDRCESVCVNRLHYNILYEIT